MKKLAVFLVLVMAVGCLAFNSESVFMRGRMGGAAQKPLQDISNSILVTPDDNLQDAYDWLKSSNRNNKMGGLASDNWRAMKLATGKYVQTIVCDTDYIALVGIGSRDDTIIHSVNDTTVEQTCQIMAMANLTISSVGTGASNTYGLLVSVDNNDSSYNNCFFEKNDAEREHYPIYTDANEQGTWFNCKSGDYAWRVAKDKNFSPTMKNCTAGTFSFGGDQNNDLSGTGTISGLFINCRGSTSCFGGCGMYGMAIGSSAEFRNCTAGNTSFGRSKAVAGSFYNCVGGSDSFAASLSSEISGTFSGIAYNCQTGANSFGGEGGKITGSIINCEMTGSSEPINLEGAEIKGSYIQITATDVNCIILSDSNSVIYNSTLIANGSGKSIMDDGSGSDGNGDDRNVKAAHNRMNNGLGTNVNNLIGTPYNATDTDIE